LWDPIFRFDFDSGLISREGIEIIDAFFDRIMKSYTCSNEFIVEDFRPRSGLFQLIQNGNSVLISKAILVELSVTASAIYNLAEIKVKESPKRNDVFGDLETIEFHAEQLYRAMIESNYYTKMAFHEDASLSRDDEDIYNEANGQSLPRVFTDYQHNKKGWPDSLMSLINLMNLLKDDYRLALNPGNGALFQKSVGSSDFILAWNAHIIMELLDIPLTTTPNSVVWEYAQILKEFAVKHIASLNWQSYHFGSILDWKASVKETRLCIIGLANALSAGNLKEEKQNNLLIQLQRMRDRESWLLSSPGRNTSDRGLAKGNFPLFSDPTVPIELPDHP
jgi:hypothetical protein